MKTEKITEANELTENHIRRTHFQPPKIPLSPLAGAPQQSPAPVSKNIAFVNEVRASSPHLAGSLKTKSNPYITDRQRTNTAPFNWAIVSLLLPSTVFVLDIHRRKGVTTLLWVCQRSQGPDSDDIQIHSGSWCYNCWQKYLSSLKKKM